MQSEKVKLSKYRKTEEKVCAKIQEICWKASILKSL